MKAKDYKKLIEKKETQLLNIELPSGAVFICRRPPVKQWIFSGKLPSSLASKLAKGVNDIEAFQRSLDTDDTMLLLEIGRDLILHCVVEPKLSVKPQGDDEIAPEDIEPEDFEFLLMWVLSGGAEAKALETFRQQRTGSVKAGLYGGEVQPATVADSQIS